MPVFTNSQQVTLVLQSLLLGVGIGAVYDMLRALRLHFRCGWAGAALLEAIMRLLQVLAKLRRAVYGLRMHCQTVVKQRCSPVKIRFLTKKFEKDSFLFRKKGIK